LGELSGYPRIDVVAHAVAIRIRASQGGTLFQGEHHGVRIGGPD
jgi:hypothetical protein